MSKQNNRLTSSLSPDFTDQIINLITQKEGEELAFLLSDYHTFDIANAIPFLDQAERNKLYLALDEKTLSDLFTHLEDPSNFIEELEDEQVVDIIEEMSSSEAVDILEELDQDKQDQIFSLLNEDSKRDLELINAYDDHLIGSLITNDFIAVSSRDTVKKVMRKVINDAGEKDNVSTVFVTDERGVYQGAIRLNDLVIARENTPLCEIIITAFPHLLANSPIKDSLQSIKDYAEPSLPVLDDDNRLIGALTSADLMDLIDEEITDDFARLVGLNEQTIDSANKRKQFFSNAFKRLPWLVILLLLDLFIGAYVGIFEAVVIGLPFIVSFQQLVSGMSGNTGTQTLAVTVSLLAESESNANDKKKLLLNEIKVGFFIGLITGAISLVAVCLYSYLTHSTPTFLIALKTGFAVGLSMFASALVSTATGSLIPLTLHKMGVDPAVASGPLITTFNDLCAISIYYGIALLLLI